MYRGEGETGPRIRLEGWDRLELAARRLMEDYQRQLEYLAGARARAHELEETIESLTGGGLDPIALSERVELLEAKNQQLRERLDQARSEVERIMARLDFLEGQS